VIDLASRLEHRVADRAAHHRALGEPARLRIVDALADRPLLLSELGRITGLHRNTLRSHLARLERAGLVARERVQSTGPGRPADRYHLAGRSTDGQGTEQNLLIHALVRLVANAYGATAADEAEREGRRVGLELGGGRSLRSLRESLAEVTDVLRRLAFSPVRVDEPSISRIALRSCPFAVSPDDPRGGIVCAFHLGLIRGVLAASQPAGSHEVALLPHVEPGLCRTEIRYDEAS
jgi:predicted ArsR family transcriptional regulator